jgi:hypothetical protein
MKSPQTRKEKIDFIKGLMSGKTSIKDLIEPITGVVFSDGDEVFAYQSISGRQVFETPIPITEFKEKYSHHISFHDFTGKQNS